MIRKTIDRIRTSLKLGQYTSEASISQGVVLPVLQALDWPVFDTSVVRPQFPVENRWVDFALCEASGDPRIFVEVKKIGHAKITGDKQLFEYAFLQGVQMAILTDGQEWSFYLPGEVGHYQDRRVYKLDLLERSPEESTERLHRYLEYQRVISGEALSTARDDYQDVQTVRLIAATIPEAWHQLLSGPDDLLLDLLADKVEDICGYKPDPDACSQFIQTKADLQTDSESTTDTGATENEDSEETGIKTGSESPGERGYSFLGKFYPAKFAWQVVKGVITTFAQREPDFLDRFATRSRSRKRSFVARNKSDLYPGRPDLAESFSEEVLPGWWMGTNYGKVAFEKKARLACEVANVEFGTEMEISL